MNEYYERLIKATIELSIVLSNTANEKIQTAAIRGYNAIMEAMKDDKKFHKAVIS